MSNWYLSNIPKVVHFYWGGRMSYLRYLSIASFRLHNPDWVIKIHTPENPSDANIIDNERVHIRYNQYDWFDELKKLNTVFLRYNFNNFLVHANEVHRSDFMRWVILSTEGGVWSDCDILYTKPMSSLIENSPANAHIKTGLVNYKQHEPPHHNAIGFLLSSPNNMYFANVLNHSVPRYSSESYQCMGSRILNYVSVNPFDTVILDPECVYFYEAMQESHLFSDSIPNLKQFDKCIGYHWFGGHPISQKYQEVCTPDFLKKDTSLLSTLARTFCKEIL